MYKRNRVTALLAACMIASSFPAAVAAAPIEITTTVKPSLDKAIANADRTQAGKISTQFTKLHTTLEQTKELDVKIKSLQTGNKENLAAVNKLIKQIDAARLDKLEADTAQTRERYKPLFDRYTALNKQIEAARQMKSKELTLMLRLQANVMKISVQMARIEIKAKEAIWRTAKDNATKTMKQIRAVLADIDPLKEQIKTRQSGIKTIEANAAASWKAYKQAVKDKDHRLILDTLASAASLSGQAYEERQKVVQLETKISGILATARKQVP